MQIVHDVSAHGGDEKYEYKILIGKPEGKTPLGRPRPRWKDNIKMDLREMRLKGVNWIHLAQDLEWWQVLVSMVMNLQVP
jgi:hypothetical protein